MIFYHTTPQNGGKDVNGTLYEKCHGSKMNDGNGQLLTIKCKFINMSAGSSWKQTRSKTYIKQSA